MKDSNIKLGSFGNYGMHILKCPSGRYTYCGSIPICFMIETNDPRDRMHGRTHKCPVFETEQEAVDFFNEHKHLLEEAN